MEIDRASLSVPSGKVVIGARFEITGVHTAPASINVQLSNGTTLIVGLSEHAGTTAYYSTHIQTGLTVTTATAVVASNWSGQFRLACYTFQSGTTTGGGTSAGTSSGTGSSGATLGGSTSGGAGQTGSGNTAAGTAGTGAQVGTTVGSSGFPAGATGEAAAIDHRTPSWPLIALGIAGLLGAAALTVRSAHGKRVR